MIVESLQGRQRVSLTRPTLVAQITVLGHSLLTPELSILQTITTLIGHFAQFMGSLIFFFFEAMQEI